MPDMKFLTRPYVEAYHAEVLAATGGAPGLRDASMLESALTRPRNKYHYEDADVYTCAAAYAFGVCKNHPFIDGSKRTAAACVWTFLFFNGHRFFPDEAEMVAAFEGLAADQVSEEELAEWIEVNTTPRAAQ